MDGKAQAMHALAARVRGHAHAPYSRHQVAAVVRGASGALYAGCNVENAAFPLGNCAEASAIAAMVTAGEKRIIEALIMGPVGAPCMPCGGCRQRLAEFADAAIPVHIADPDRVLRSTTLGALLPEAFSLRPPP
ncbi:MAG: cytidine deaminase [Pseudomonadota bacterium]